MPSSCALLGGFAIGAQVSMTTAPDAKCQRVLVLALCLVLKIGQLNALVSLDVVSEKSASRVVDFRWLEFVL